MSVLADWLVRQAPAWLEGRHGPLAPHARRALVAITRCRTPALGGRVYRCTDCQGTDYAYHSCHHRACPRCGGQDAAEWTRAQEEKLLPVPYFFWTFTVPATLRAAFAAQPALLADLLFANAFRALQSVAARAGALGAQIGATAVIHTWGRQLQHHPHLHIITPGGGLSFDNERWIETRNPKWFLPIGAVASAFRDGFEQALAAEAPALHAAIPDSTWRKDWNVDIKHAGSGREVVRYLARYVKRTAISDERIMEADDEHVRFRYTDSETGQPRELTLSAEAFMRRYLRHVPVPGQHRVRYFGWMHPAAKRRRMKIEGLLKKEIVVRKEPVPPDWSRQCPHCNKFTLEFYCEIPRGLPMPAKPRREALRCASP
jgi:hypothetical protein